MAFISHTALAEVEKAANEKSPCLAPAHCWALFALIDLNHRYGCINCQLRVGISDLCVNDKPNYWFYYPKSFLQPEGRHLLR